MFSGKTEELMRRIRRARIAKQKVCIYKPVTDDRYACDAVVSHAEVRFPCVAVEWSKEIALDVVNNRVEVVAVDEAQFFDDRFPMEMDALANSGHRVIVAGLDLDYSGVPFGTMPSVLARADDITKLRAICIQCGSEASRTQWTGGEDPRGQIEVGGGEKYEARCRDCWNPV